MKRGEIYFADLNPTKGREIRKRRPVLIVSNNANNRASDTLTIVPLTSKVARVYPFEVKSLANESGLSQDSKAMAQQVRTISKERIVGGRAGAVPSALMERVDAALRMHLAL